MLFLFGLWLLVTPQGRAQLFRHVEVPNFWEGKSWACAAGGGRVGRAKQVQNKCFLPKKAFFLTQWHLFQQFSCEFIYVIMLPCDTYSFLHSDFFISSFTCATYARSIRGIDSVSQKRPCIFLSVFPPAALLLSCLLCSDLLPLPSLCCGKQVWLGIPSTGAREVEQSSVKR